MFFFFLFWEVLSYCYWEGEGMKIGCYRIIIIIWNNNFGVFVCVMFFFEGFIGTVLFYFYGNILFYFYGSIVECGVIIIFIY